MSFLRSLSSIGLSQLALLNWRPLFLHQEASITGHQSHQVGDGVG